MDPNGSWVIKGGTLVDPQRGELAADIKLAGGRIAAVGTDLASGDASVYDARGKHIFPGFIDTHVHLAFLAPFEEECPTETQAAAAGGVTTIFHFAKILAYRPTQTSYHEVLDQIFSDINRLASVDVALHLQLSTYEQIAEIGSYAARGLTSFKLFMSYKDDPAAIKRGTIGVGDGEIFAALQETSRIPGTLAIIHCENWDLVRYFERSIKDKTNASFLDLVDAHPGIAEADHVRRACYYASVTGAPLYIVHMTSKEGIEAANEYRLTARSPFYVETCPQYLVLDQFQANALPGAAAKTTPPVRDRHSIDALWKAVESGNVDTIGSDHAVVPMAKKAQLWDGFGGLPGVETGMPLVISEARRRGISLTKVAQICSYNAARTFGLLPFKGTLTPGGDGDLAIMDLDREQVVSVKSQHSSADYTPFEGFRVRGCVDATFLRGQPIFLDGELVNVGRGRVVLRGQQVRRSAGA